jgi:hypothetical protein
MTISIPMYSNSSKKILVHASYDGIDTEGEESLRKIFLYDNIFR